MRGFRMLSTVVFSAWLAGSALAAGPKLTCGQASKCPGTVLSDLRAAVDTACPCDAAASQKKYAKCWKPVVSRFAKTLGKKGFPKRCRKEVGNVLGANTCGRSGFVLCRKKGGRTCTIAKAKRCKDVFPTGSGFRSCTDACDGMVALPFPSTIELAHNDLASLAADPGDGTLHFAAAPRSLDGVEVGKVIVAGVSPGSPGGLLRVVAAVDRSGQELTLRTVQAPIQLAYAQVHVHATHSTALAASSAPADVSSATMPAIVPLLDFGSKKEFSYILFDGDGDKETKDDQVAIDGEIGGGFDYDFALDFDWPSLDDLPGAVGSCLKAVGDLLTGKLPDCSIAALLPEAKVTFNVRPQVEANTNVHGAALLGYKKDIPLVSETLTPIPIGPLIFVPKAEITGKLEGGASGMFSTGVHGSMVFETKVTVSSKHTGTPDYQPPKLVSQDFGANETKITLKAEARVGIAAGLSVLLYDVTGPYVTAEPYAAIEANIFDAPCWNLHAGLDAQIGVKVQSPDLPLIGSVTLVDWKAPTVNPLDLPIADGGCSTPPNDDHPFVPGSGPDAVHLAMPTYTRWSRTYDSPVDGSGTHFPNNSISFSDLQRTIDDRFVRSGFDVQALTKFDELGNLTWARALALDGTALPPLRVRSATDATLLVVSGLPEAIVVVKVAQDGSVVEARSYDVPPDVCSIDVNAITAAANDGGDGLYVVGRCSGDPRSFVLHTSGSGATLRLIGDIDGLRVNVVEPIGSDVFLAGSASEGGDRLYAFRIAADGTVVYSNRYDGCLSAPDAIPSTAIVGSQGDVTIAGSGGAEHNGLILRLLPNGNVGFAAFPGFGFGAANVLILDSLVQLPTTGYVAGCTSAHNNAVSEPDSVQSACLVGLDSVGTVIWGNRYTFGTTGAYSASGQVAVRLADDGGVVAAALLADANDPFTGGRLWAFKPFAKDGSADFLPGSVTTTPLGITDLSCSMTASDRPVTVDTRAISSRAVTVTSTPVTLAVDQQTAN